MTSRPASFSSSVNPLWRHVVSNEPPHPWTRTTGGPSAAATPRRLRQRSRPVATRPSEHLRASEYRMLARPSPRTRTAPDTRMEFSDGAHTRTGAAARSIGWPETRAPPTAPEGRSTMRLLHPEPGHDLTYNDVFMVPSLSSVGSRLDVDLIDAGRDRHPPARRRLQHDGRRRAPDGRDRGPPRRHLGAAPGHPARRRRERHRVRQGVPSRLRDADHAELAPHDRRRPRPDPQARPRRGRRRRRRRPPARRVHRAGRRRLRPLHAAARRDEPRARHRGRRDERPRCVRPAHREPPLDGARRRRRRAPRRRRHAQGRAALDDVPTGARRRGPPDDRRRRRRQRRSRHQGQGARRARRRCARHRHRPRSPDPHAPRPRVGPRRRPRRADRRRQRRHRPGHAPADRGRRRHRQGRRRARRDVHDADDDRGRPAAVLRRRRVRRRGDAASASTCGRTAACAGPATSPSPWPAARRA